MAKKLCPLSSLIFLLVVLSISLTSQPGATATGRMVGGRRQVKDVKTNKEVQELGMFSVKEFNMQRGGHGGNGGDLHELLFSEVVEAQVQVVSGLKYYLKVEVTTKDEEAKVYESVVVVKPWLRDSKKLLSFGPSTSGFITL